MAFHLFLVTVHYYHFKHGWVHGTPRTPTSSLSWSTEGQKKGLLKDRNRAVHQVPFREHVPKAGPSHPLSEHRAGKRSKLGKGRVGLGSRRINSAALQALGEPFSWVQQGLPSFSFLPEPLGYGADTHHA